MIPLIPPCLCADLSQNKRSFVLLEALIALSLLVIFGSLLILKPYEAYRTELRFFKEAEKERLADWTFSEVKEKILKKEIAIDPFLGNQEKHRLSDGSIDLVHGQKVKIERSFSIAQKKDKLDLNGNIVRLMKISIYLKEGKTKQYNYDLCISSNKFAALYEERTKGPE